MKKKIGIIGYGGVAIANHKNSYALAKDAEIVAVADFAESLKIKTNVLLRIVW